MDKKDLMADSDSDDSDADYVPPGEENNLPSEEDSEGEPEGVFNEEDGESTGKRKSQQKKGRNKKSKPNGKRCTDVMAPIENDNLDGEEQENKTLTEEDEKKKTDLLWMDFLKTTDSPRSKLTSTSVNKKEEATTTEVPTEKKKEKVSITQVFKFAGEEVKVVKEVPADSPEAQESTTGLTQPASAAFRGGKARPINVAIGGGRGASNSGLSAILGKIGKKDKIGTLEKSKLDWERFKKSEGLEEDLKVHNRGKDGYLEKQDFLQRADVRQFEIEKEIRTTRRSSRP